MSDLAAYPPQTAYQDRSTGLVVMGILEICLALLCLLFLGFMAIATLSLAASPAGRDAGLNLRSLLGGGLVYLFAGAFFGTLGIGTLRGRRWARTIGFVTSWMWLVFGLFGCVAMIFVLPRMSAGFSAAAGSAASPGIGMFMTGCIGFMLFLIYLVLPGILLLFYRGANVKATVEAKDPTIPWTDRVPAPVLALTLMLVLAGAGSLLLLSYGIFPLAGKLLTGIPAVLSILVSAALAWVLAWGIYQRRLAYWWAAVVLFILSCVNGSLLLVQGSAGMHRVYEAAMPPAQLQQIDRMGLAEIYSSPGMLAVMALGWLGAFAYLLWTRRFFTGEAGRV
jgi:hypothetical protein